MQDLRQIRQEAKLTVSPGLECSIVLVGLDLVSAQDYLQKGQISGQLKRGRARAFSDRDQVEGLTDGMSRETCINFAECSFLRLVRLRRADAVASAAVPKPNPPNFQSRPVRELHASTSSAKM